MAKLSSLDASFLRMETATAHMHVGWLSLLDLPPGLSELDTDALTERIAGRLHLAPRFVLLTVVGGALRRLAAARSERPGDLRVMVPVSVRSAEEAQEGGNRITFAFVDLPVTERDLARVREQTLDLKTSGRVAGSDLLLRSLGALPKPLQTSAARLAAYADPGALPHASRLPMMLADSIEELAIGTGAPDSRARPAARRYVRAPTAP